MEDRHPTDAGIGEVHDEIDGAADRHVHRVEPHGVGATRSVFRVREEVRLVNVKRMDLARLVDDAPVLVSADGDAHERRRCRGKCAVVDVKALRVLGERDDELRW